jgi:hypothetical protein
MRRTLGFAVAMALCASGAAFADSFSFRLEARIPVRCEGHGVGSPARLQVRQACNTPHIVRVTPDRGWRGRIVYRGKAAVIARGESAEFIFRTVEEGTWPVSFEGAAPVRVQIEVAPL